MVISPFNLNFNDQTSAANQFLNFWNKSQVIQIKGILSPSIIADLKRW